MHVDHSLVSSLGYAMVLAGCVLEGETVLIAAGFAAQQGYLSLPLVVLAAWIGAASGDHFFFVLGRYKGGAILDIRPAWGGRMRKTLGLLERYETAAIVGARFIYGCRVIGPFAFGTAHVRLGRFLFLDLASGFLWSCLFGVAGYLFGTTLGHLLGDLRFRLVALSVVVGLVVFIVVRRPAAGKEAGGKAGFAFLSRFRRSRGLCADRSA
jgi:membrane protein DedA with SNARE-associated domain